MWTAILYIFSGFFVSCLIIFFIKITSVRDNKKSAYTWFHEMDVAVQGQRYQGSRAVIIAEIFSGKISSTVYQIELACKTPSGRAFLIDVSSSFGHVVGWNLIPVPLDQLMSVLREEGFEFKENTSVENETETGAKAKNFDHNLRPTE